MMRSIRQPSYLLVVALAMLSLRALTPDGYMPGSKDSGLLYELCPSGMPPEIMQVLAGHGHHHHHQHGADEGASVSATEQCPIGHMLASAAVTDTNAPTELLPDATFIVSAPRAVHRVTGTTAFRSRAPPA
jgi:hypothetical protein